MSLSILPLSREDYVKTLVPVAICSASNPCPICQEEYSELHTPVLLPGCGHIFGRSCIQEWLEADANTCPMDRKVLFASQMESDSNEDRNWPSNLHASSYFSHPIHSRHWESGHDYYLLSSGEIIGLNGMLTQEGCHHTVCDLWLQTGFFFRQMGQRAGDVELFSVSEDLLLGLIQDALPLGIQVPTEAWSLLIGMARTMLVWHCQVWEDGWSERDIPEEAAWRFAQDLWMFCGGDDRVRL